MMKDIAEAGDAVVQAAGGLGDALFQFQEHEFRTLQPQFNYTRENRQWIPRLSDEMLETMRVGVAANYTRPQPNRRDARGPRKMMGAQLK